jgi:DNA-binding response OmpR family regulator
VEGLHVNRELFPDHSTPAPRFVLLVDDDLLLRRALHELLAGHGFDVIDAGTGAEALQLARTATLAAVVLDLGLPDICGANVLAELITIQPVTPVIVFSGSLCEELIEQLQSAGAARCVQKPDATGMLAALDECVPRDARGCLTVAGNTGQLVSTHASAGVHRSLYEASDTSDSEALLGAASAGPLAR